MEIVHTNIYSIHRIYKHICLQYNISEKYLLCTIDIVERLIHLNDTLAEKNCLL